MYVSKVNGERLTDAEYESLCRREAKEQYQWEDPEDWNNNFNDFFENFMKEQIDQEFDYVPDKKEDIFDIIQDLGNSGQYPELVSWFGDYNMYERCLDVKDEQLMEAYENMRSNELKEEYKQLTEMKANQEREEVEQER